MKSLLVIILITIIDFVISYLDYTEANWPDTCKNGKRQTPIDFSKSIKYRIDNNYIKLWAMGVDAFLYERIGGTMAELQAKGNEIKGTTD